MSQLSMDVNFGGQLQSLKGNVEVKGYWDAVSKAILSCIVTWILGAFLIVVPFVNWTMPVIFLFFGPILGVMVFFMDRRFVNRLDVEAVCPQCQNSFEIHEKNFTPPFYGHCPNCRASFALDVPKLSYND